MTSELTAKLIAGAAIGVAVVLARRGNAWCFPAAFFAVFIAWRYLP